MSVVLALIFYFALLVYVVVWPVKALAWLVRVLLRRLDRRSGRV